MKKVIIVFIILIMLAGVVLYFGWVSIKPGYFGVAFSSITGIENYPLEAGKFYWLWQKLIPKHFDLYLIKNTPTIIDFSYSTTLPGSEDLKDYGNFDIGIAGKVQYSIDFKIAKILISKGIIKNHPDYFKKIIENSVQKSVSQFILQIFNNFNNGKRKLNYLILDQLKENIIKNISNELSEYGIVDFKLDISYSSIPQIDIYSKALQLYTDYISAVYQSKKEELERKAKVTAKYEMDKAELKHLEDIGILVEKYPNLLKYMYIEKLGDKINVVVLPEGKSGFPTITEPKISPEAPTGKKNFIPIPELPQDNLEKNSPSTQKFEGNIPEESSQELGKSTTESNMATGKEAESSITKGEKEKKWYDYLKFWELIKKR